MTMIKCVRTILLDMWNKRRKVTIASPELEKHQCDFITAKGTRCEHSANRVIRVGPIVDKDGRTRWKMLHACGIHHSQHAKAVAKRRAARGK